MENSFARNMDYNTPLKVLFADSEAKSEGTRRDFDIALILEFVKTLSLPTVQFETLYEFKLEPERQNKIVDTMLDKMGVSHMVLLNWEDIFRMAGLYIWTARQDSVILARRDASLQLEEIPPRRATPGWNAFEAHNFKRYWLNYLTRRTGRNFQKYLTDQA